MISREALAAFAKRFVEYRLRERFVYEALKKPQVLHRRISHNMESRFLADAEKYRGRDAPFADADACLFFNLPDPPVETDWRTARETMQQYGGGDYLVIKADGSAFYAEAEGEPPVCYAGGR